MMQRMKVHLISISGKYNAIIYKQVLKEYRWNTLSETNNNYKD